MRLTNKDYIKIVKHYGKTIPLTKRRKVDNKKTRKIARQILANKLCMCIKKVQKSNKNLNEPAALAICNKSIFQKRNIKHYKFTCKKGAKLHNMKGEDYALTKTRKNIVFRKKNRSQVRKSKR